MRVVRSVRSLRGFVHSRAACEQLALNNVWGEGACPCAPVGPCGLTPLFPTPTTQLPPSHTAIDNMG